VLYGHVAVFLARRVRELDLWAIGEVGKSLDAEGIFKGVVRYS
jgi:hypothetical protein